MANPVLLFSPFNIGYTETVTVSAETNMLMNPQGQQHSFRKGLEIIHSETSQ